MLSENVLLCFMYFLFRPLCWGTFNLIASIPGPSILTLVINWSFTTETIIKAGTVNMHNQMMIHYLMANKLLYNIPLGPQPLRIQQYAYIKATA